MIRVGLFTAIGLLLLGALTVFINDRPFWWRGCDLVNIQVDDATGLKAKSPVRSLGLQIGYLKYVQLVESKVRLGICITAPVEVLPETRFYIRGEGFLGDKFVELRPVHYYGDDSKRVKKSKHPELRLETGDDGSKQSELGSPVKDDTTASMSLKSKSLGERIALVVVSSVISLFSSESMAQSGDPNAREVMAGKQAADLDKLMDSSDRLVRELTDLTKDLNAALNPDDLKNTIKQLNKTLENAGKILSPDGGINQTAKRALEKLEDSFEQLRQQLTRINKGEGSLGRLINDPVYAEEILTAMKNINTILYRVSQFRFVINMGAEQIPVYEGGRGFFQLSLWPNRKRYYLLGITIDPRGRLQVTNTTTQSGGTETRVRTEQTVEGGFLLTGMIGKVFFDQRLDLSAGALHGDGALSIGVNLGPKLNEDILVWRNDFYSRGRDIAINNRSTVIYRPFHNIPGMHSIYVKGGIESIRKVDNKIAYLFGAGVSFDDDDIKVLFAFR